MKKIIIPLILALGLGSCDRESEEISPVVQQTIPEIEVVPQNTPGQTSTELVVGYFPSEPMLINIDPFIDVAGKNSFKIKEAPNSGDAEILMSSFLKYNPTGNIEDKIVLMAFDSNNNNVGEVTILLEASDEACGIAIFDRATIKSNSSLSINLANNDLICEQIENITLEVIYIENWNGLKIEIPRPDSTTPTPGTIQLTYKAPAGFAGKVTAMYTAAINIKDEYRNQWASGEDVFSHPEYFKFYVSSMVEIEVVADNF